MQRIDFIGTRFSITNPEDAFRFLEGYDCTQTGYVCFPDLFVISKAAEDPLLQKILNNSLLTVPDGKPLEFWAKMKGYSQTRTVSGYWLIRSLLKTSHTHFFYGGNAETTERMRKNLMREFPDARILGYASPPFLNLLEIEGNGTILKDLQDIAELKPDFIWIGISSPTQEYLMHFFTPGLQHGVLLGVGGVFDYISGDHKKSPEWIKTIGLRWLYRMVQAPRRLWKKYHYILRTMTRVPFSGKQKDHFVS